MKKLLCILSLVHTLSMHAMDDWHSCPPINKSIVPASLTQSGGWNLEYANNQDDHTELTSTGSLRTNTSINGDHSRFSFVYIDRIINDDTDDEWIKIEEHEPAEIRLIDAANTVLLKAQNLLPANFKNDINTDLHNSLNPLKDLQHAREMLWFYLTRSDTDFEKSYEKTLNKNFEPCKQFGATFDPLTVYNRLGCNDHPAAIAKPNAHFAAIIARNLETASATNNAKEQWFMRQFGFIFRNPVTKQAYDTYLTGGCNALKSLKINEDMLESLQKACDDIMEAKGALSEFQKRIKTDEN